MATVEGCRAVSMFQAGAIVGAVMIRGGDTFGAAPADLARYLAEVYALERSITAGTEYLLRVSVTRFCQWLGRPAVLADLTDFQVSRFLRDLEESGDWAPKTIAGRRGDLLAIWRHAAEAGLVDPPKRVRGVRVPESMPVAWSLAEFDAILRACLALEGFMVNGLPRPRYFWAVFKVAYETGLRRSDVFRVQLSGVRADGRLTVVQQKTKRCHVVAVRDDTLAALRVLAERLARDGDPAADRPLRWPYTPRAFYEWTSKITGMAGVRPGSLQQCRRTGATHCESVEAGSATRFLGHSSSALARKHYVDASQAYGVLLPPKVGGQ